MSSSTYKRFSHLQIPLEEIASATSNFSDANFINETPSGKVYKGQLLWSEQLMNVVAERFRHELGDVEFWKEISILSSLKHENLVTIIGFCDEGGEKIMITKLEGKGRLDKFLGDLNLTWMQRLQISVGVAQALNYIYYDEQRDFSVIHRNIMSSKILLDDNWEPKLSGFEASINQTAAQRDSLLVTEFCGTPEYSDPMYLKNGTVRHKSDIYSFGVVLFELLCGKKATMADETNVFSAQLTRFRYEKETVEDMIDPGLRKQMDPESLKIFSEIAYYCLMEQPFQRPTIDRIVVKLQKASEYQRKHENPEENLKHLRIPLTDIEKATENFADKYLIGSGTFGMVYKAELEHRDGKSFLPSAEKNMTKLSRKRNIVAIKRILVREDKHGEEGFNAEIEMLSRCKDPNVVSLLGFCNEGRHMILVYEYASKGSLDDYLRSTGNMATLTWTERIKICIDAAQGLNYLHTKLEDDRTIIHHDIKSGNILLGDNWVAKIGDFGLSRLLPKDQLINSLYSKHIKGTQVYWCPEYETTGKLSNKIDIYSFGVILFEMLSGRFANDKIYTQKNTYGIAPVARQHFEEGTIMDMVDPRLMEETYENILSLNKGPHQDSLDVFSKIAYECVAVTQVNRPTAEVIIKKLEEALCVQQNNKDNLQISLADIKLATQNFSDDNIIGGGEFGKVYKGELQGNRCNHIAAKRLYTKPGEGEQQFLLEMQILLEYRHENIAGLVGYCNEMGEKIIVYEHASRGSLDNHLKDNDLTWMKRLQICIDIASGLNFLHGDAVAQKVVIHKNIQSSNIILYDEGKAKITDFGLTYIAPINKYKHSVFSSAIGTIGYADPLYESPFITKECDIFSFGEVLLEILSGCLASKIVKLVKQFRRHHEEGTLDEIVFKGIKEQIKPKSLYKFQMIIHQCLHLETQKRPTASEVLLQLKEALEFQMEKTASNDVGTSKKRVTLP